MNSFNSAVAFRTVRVGGGGSLAVGRPRDWGPAPVLCCPLPLTPPGTRSLQSTTPFVSRTGAAQGSCAVKQEPSPPRAKRPRLLPAPYCWEQMSCQVPWRLGPPPHHLPVSRKCTQCWDNQHASFLDPDSDEPREKPSPGPLTERTGLRARRAPSQARLSPRHLHSRRRPAPSLPRNCNLSCQEHSSHGRICPTSVTL